MNLSELIEALAGEVDLVAGELAQLLATLLTVDETEPAFLDALDGYNGQVERLGAAAEVAGFGGLMQVCACVGENAMAAAASPQEERERFRPFLAGWPPLVVNYLRNLSDPSTAAGLVDHLKQAPLPLDEPAALKLMHMLGATPQSDLALEAGGSARPIVATAEDVELLMPEEVEPALLEGFVHEAPGQTAELSERTRRLLAGEGDSTDIAVAKRIAHTLKGSASIIGIRGITTIAHHTEDIFEYLERHEAAIPPAVAEALLEAAYCLEQMIGYLLADDERPGNAQAVLQAVLDVANRLDRGEAFDTAPLPRPRVEPVVLAAAAAPVVSLSAGGAALSRGAPTTPTSALRVPVPVVDELFRVSGEMSVRMAAMETRLKEAMRRSRELMEQNLRLQKRLFELETLVDVRALTMMRARGQRPEQAGSGPAFDPLEFDQYNELHSTTHALIEEAADARAMGTRLEDEIAQLQASQLRQQRLTSDLQRLVTSTRMTAVGVLVPRLQRNVRATCQATGKQAELIVEGTDIQIDGDVLNRLADPLLHILRNAVDHGIEPPEDRQAAGKPTIGTVRLRFERQGQQAVVRCSDDGSGLDLAAVHMRALERGLIQAGQELSDDELAHLVFLPGFSTREAVTEISGRGVGLDVVRDWAQSMNGSVRIDSRPGQGSTITLRFQALLTTTHALIVEAAGQRLALPSVTVVQAVARGLGEFELTAGELLFRLGRQTYPALRVAIAAGLADDDKPIADHDVVLVRIDDSVRALAVDRLVDARDLLIKDAGRFARHLGGVGGLSILGDGTVAVMLDLPQLLAAARGEHRPRAAAGHDAQLEAANPGVLIVDDSLSVRNSLSQLMADAGYRVHTARDGVDAVEALRSFTPDIVLTDLEMPNMNGLELTAHIRNRDDLRQVPVLMITSRSQEKHRRQAAQAGVDHYFTKPYTDTDLLNRVRQSLAA